MMSQLHRALDRPAARFLVGGAGTTLVSYAVYLGLLHWLPYLGAYWIAFAVGIAWSYLTNTLFVFRTRPTMARALAFPLVYLAQWAFGSIVLVGAVDGMHVPASIGPLVVVIASLPLTYFLSKWILTARGSSAPAGEARGAGDASPAGRISAIDGLNRQDPQAYFAERSFDDRLQASLPAGSSVFELPYTFFPESPQRGGSYLLIEPYLRTHGLRWSFGTMRGRPGDVWYERASRLTGQEFADALATAGFAAAYVDGRAYDDGGAAIMASLRALFGGPIIEDASTHRALFRVPPARPRARPLVVASTDRGWHTQGAASATLTWSTGSARLAIANPTDASQRVHVTFRLASRSPRKVDIAYAKRVLSGVALTAAAPSDISIAFPAAPGITWLDLDTDVPAQPSGDGDPRRLGFGLSDLSVTVE